MCEGRSETATLEFRSGISWEGSRRGVEEEEGVWNSRKRTSSAPGILVLQQQRRQQQEKEE